MVEGSKGTGIMASSSTIPRAKPTQNKFETQLELLSSQWDLGLEPLKDYSSTKIKTKAQKCIGMLSFCSHTGIYEECIEVFERKAEEVAHQWAKKPKEDQGILPETNRQKKRSVLIDHLFDILYDRIRTHPRSPKHIRQKTIPSPKANLPPLSLHGLELKKRLVQIDEPFEDVPLVKKQRSQSSGRSTTHNNFSEFKDSAIFVESVPTDSCQINTGVGDAVPSSPQLDKLKLDFSHRLGRRFGHDRFFELCVPALTGKGHLPDVLKSGKALEIIQDWLIDTAHPLIGRFWQPFFVKPKEKRKRNRDIIKDIEEVEPAFRIYLFATSGPGFQDDEDLIKHPDPPRGHPLMSIAQLLNRIRPTRKNEHQSYLKLFQRTSLAVSRNRATVTLSKDQIRFREKDIYSTKGEVMNDGAARISPTLAGKIALMIGLDLIPSVFQGRFGEAKGLWVVDYNDKEGDDWIEIYPSQQKWTRSNKHAGESDDISHRTFEVLEWSRPPKSATLNTQFVPILMDRARDKESMKESLSELVRSGLSVEIDAMIAAMDDPLSFYEWVRKCNPNFDERLKTGAISFQGGMPVVQEEKLNLLLGSGFDPRKLTYMRDIAKDVFKDKCNNLQDRLKIKVGRSAYLYMVPDFWGVLEPDEVYIDFSSFTDGINGLSNVALDGSEVLVARSPAHYPSDIQSVKAVTKVELIGLKNVIVFSTKGSTDGGRSLASKLSGGDYDGDQAWVCWEPSIVSNFITADMPEPIDLVTEGFMKRDTTTYADLKREHQHTTSVFLKKSFAFNMKRSLLGICTNFKERVACTQRRLDTPELRYLCQLASDLVDAPKQGFTFGDAEFELLKREKVKIFIKEQLWKTQRPSRNPDHHIIDHLMYVAHKAVLKALTYFHETFNYHSAWDDDLASYGRFALAQAEKFPDWKLLMEDLKKDIQVVQDKWIAYSAQPEHSKLPFSPFCEDCYADFQAIMPHDMNTSLAQSLLPDSGNRNSELSNWALLKASTLFASYSRKYVAKRVWWLAGIQLCHLKPDYDKTGRPYSIVSGVHLCMKPDGSLIRRRQAGAGVESNLEEVSVEEDMAVIND